MSNSFIMTESIVRPAKMPYGRLKDNGFVGIEGEHAARALVVETKDDLSAFASVNLIIDDLDCGAMTKTTSGNTTTLSMTLTSSMIGRSGRKICQLIMVNSGNTVVQKSSQFEAYVGRANEIERSVDDGVTIIILSEAVTEMAREAASAAAEEAVADVVEDCQAIADAASASADAAAQSATDAQTAAASITVDATLDPTSTHAIQNKAVASEIAGLKADLGDVQTDLSESMNRTAPSVYGTSTGYVFSVSDGADWAVRDLSIEINPVQAGSGDPSSSNIRAISGRTSARVTRCGKNLLDNNYSTYPSGQMRHWYAVDGFVLKGGLSYTLWSPEGAQVYVYFMDFETKTSIKLGYGKVTYTPETDTKVYFRAYATGVSEKHVQLEIGQDSSKYEDFNGDAYTITWQTEAGTVYKGTLDITTGVLTKTWENIASYNGETLPGAWMSDRDVYVEGTTPTTGAHVIYELAEPVEYQLAPLEIKTFLGLNNVFSITGTVGMTYVKDTEMAIEKQANDVGKTVSGISAGVESEYKATKSYTIGEYLIVGATLYQVTANIADNDAIAPGTNVTATTVGEKLASLGADKIDFPVSQGSKEYGTSGQVLVSNGNGKASWGDVGMPTTEQIATAISNWMLENPDATTTVQDESISPSKLTTKLQAEIKSLSSFSGQTDAQKLYDALVTQEFVGTLLCGNITINDGESVDIGGRSLRGVTIVNSTITLYDDLFISDAHYSYLPNFINCRFIGNGHSLLDNSYGVSGHFIGCTFIDCSVMNRLDCTLQSASFTACHITNTTVPFIKVKQLYDAHLHMLKCETQRQSVVDTYDSTELLGGTKQLWVTDSLFEGFRDAPVFKLSSGSILISNCYFESDTSGCVVIKRGQNSADKVTLTLSNNKIESSVEAIVLDGFTRSGMNVSIHDNFFDNGANNTPLISGLYPVNMFTLYNNRIGSTGTIISADVSQTPNAPTANGEYVLKATVNDGDVSYAWSSSV